MPRIGATGGLYDAQSAGGATNVTKSDTDDLAKVSRFISLSAAGDLKLTMVGGDVVTIPSGHLAAGVMHPLRATRVWNVGAQTVVVYY